jgi:hypothetical protein
MTGSGWTTFGALGRGVNQFISPTGIFLDGKDRIYVVDTDSGRLVRINDMTGSGWMTLAISVGKLWDFPSLTLPLIGPAVLPVLEQVVRAEFG